MSSETFRPGIAQGTYTERNEERGKALERALHVLRGGVARRLQSSRAQLEAFVRTVERYGAPLADESDAQIQTRIADLRLRLTLEGLSEELLPLLEETGIVLAIENHERYGYRELLGLVEDCDSSHVGVCLDSVNSLGRGEGVWEVADALLASEPVAK